MTGAKTIADIQSPDPGLSGFEPLLNLSETAELLRVDPETLQAWAREARVPSLQIGDHLLFRASALETWVQQALGSTPQYSLGYKQRVRQRAVTAIAPDQHYSPSDIAAIMNVSYDSASRLMQKMTGVIDLGTPTRRYKRGKKKLRISGRHLNAYLRTKRRD